MKHEVLYDQAAEVFGRIRQGDPEHLPEKLSDGDCGCRPPDFRSRASESAAPARRTLFFACRGRGKPRQGEKKQRSCRLVNGGTLFLRLYTSDFAGFQCAGADPNAFWLAVDQNADLLNVDAPSAAVAVIRVGNMVSCAGCLTRNEAFARHAVHLLCSLQVASTKPKDSVGKHTWLSYHRTSVSSTIVWQETRAGKRRKYAKTEENGVSDFINGSVYSTMKVSPGQIGALGAVGISRTARREGACDRPCLCSLPTN